MVTANNCCHFVAISHNHKMENSTREDMDCDHTENTSSIVHKEIDNDIKAKQYIFELLHKYFDSLAVNLVFHFTYTFGTVV